MDFESGNIFVSEQDFVKEIGHWGLHAFKVDTCDDLNIFYPCHLTISCLSPRKRHVMFFITFSI